ncbi:MAG: PEGA domain-containing protein [Polyangiales bacterium]
MNLPVSARSYPCVAAFVTLFCALLASLVHARPAAAQPLGDLVVVPFGGPDLARTVEIIPMLEAELAGARLPLVSLHDARDRFAARSRPPAMPTETDLDVLAQKAREATEHVAFGRTAAAQKSVREVISRAERALESLNRETATARNVLDACLSLVRSSLQSSKRELALDQATRCRRLVPDLAPAEDAHPANVVGVLAEADNLLRRMRIGKLTVRSAPQSHCAVYLNGRQLGSTPFRIDRAAAGEYRVQVECGRNVGRVHVVQLGDEPVELTVDSDLDRAVASEPRLLLRYPDTRTARAQAPQHAAQVGRDVGVDDVLLVEVTADRAELLRINVLQQRLLGRAQVTFHDTHGFAQPALARAIEQLAQGRDDPPADPPPPEPHPAPEPASPPPSPQVEAPPPPPAPTQRPVLAPASPSLPREVRSRRLRRAGLGLLAPAVALYALGIATEWRAQHLEDDALRLAYRPPPADPAQATVRARKLDALQSDYERARKLRWLGLGGGAVGALAASFLVSPRVPPWWSYGLGVAGLGLVGAGAYEIAARDRCALRGEDGMCRRKRGTEARGALLLAAAAPLLTVPLAQSLGAYFRSGSVHARAAPTRGGLELALHLSF